MRLKPLQPGDTLALIAPASPFEYEGFAAACELVRARGYSVVFGNCVHERTGYLAGTDSDRVQDLLRVLSDLDISAVICVRGGYGSGRLIPWLPFSNLRKNRKIFLGHSDITFLHLAFQAQMGWLTFLGPNLIGMAREQTAHAVLDVLEGKNSFSWVLEEDRILRHGIVTGNLLGGNLTCLTHLLGTPYFPDMRGALLLVEDCSESLYRLDRLFMHLKLADVLPQLGGLLLGRFKDCGEAEDIHRMVMDHVRFYRFPVVVDLPFGHIPENEVVPLGTAFTLNTHEKVLRVVRHPFAG